MPTPAPNRRKRLGFTSGAVIAGTFALTCLAAPGAAEAATASSAPATYTVQSGDSLSGIAQAKNVTGGWQALAQANGITSPYVLQPGQQLTLPGASTASSTSSVATATPASATTATSSSATTSTQSYPNNLDGWINHALAIMHQNGIPGSYDGIHRNIMRESSGNPNAINLWDSNAAAGHPSIGLLQVIQPTFTTYHVAGTSWNIYDPVANITAACNYAAHRYGSIDNVNSAY
ncbi:LysM peptidoglycan-binding domain-containing protein [Streptomyces sp. RPT161]|uniref:LysM peptidoglycan-binding domain-containing protein n=1 Tax=Streptomyces sp. RPT161 TaxID=3015993 RepID=UPI0022B93BAD|nr:LysM peptidoglycan-binding domain-containing protein [Streptomyces sp. RPT161]